jgi:hypothetical protein
MPVHMMTTAAATKEETQTMTEKKAPSCQEIRARVLGGERQRGERVHDHIDPQQLRQDMSSTEIMNTCARGFGAVPPDPDRGWLCSERQE